MMYVIPYNSALENDINEMQNVKGRLRAFPAQRYDMNIYKSKDKYPYLINFPEHVEKIILDSGAFALYGTGGKIDRNYMQALAQYYFYNANEKTMCVAPDVLFNPAQSMYNYVKFIEICKGIVDIQPVAVIQPEKKWCVDINKLMKQAEFYRKYTDTIFFSNPMLPGESAQGSGLRRLFKYMKKELKVKWIHVLGAGWNIDDIKRWKSIGYFDSMDSIAYYSSADSFGGSPVENISKIMEVMDEN